MVLPKAVRPGWPKAGADWPKAGAEAAPKEGAAPKGDAPKAGVEAAPKAGAEAAPNAGWLAPNGLAAVVVAPNPPNAGFAAPKGCAAPKPGLLLGAPNAGAGEAPNAGAGVAPNAGWLAGCPKAEAVAPNGLVWPNAGACCPNGEGEVLPKGLEEAPKPPAPKPKLMAPGPVDQRSTRSSLAGSPRACSAAQFVKFITLSQLGALLVLL